MSRAQHSVSRLTGAHVPRPRDHGPPARLGPPRRHWRARTTGSAVSARAHPLGARSPASSARDLAETDDLVQVTLVRSLSHLHEFDDRGEGAFFAYLRRALLNAIRDEIRRSRRHPARQGLDGAIADRGRSPVEDAIGREALERYDNALAELSEEQRAAVILKLEFGMTNPELAAAMGKPTPNAARMTVARALIRIAEAMDEFRP